MISLLQPSFLMHIVLLPVASDALNIHTPLNTVPRSNMRRLVAGISRHASLHAAIDDDSENSDGHDHQDQGKINAQWRGVPFPKLFPDGVSGIKIPDVKSSLDRLSSIPKTLLKKKGDGKKSYDEVSEFDAALALEIEEALQLASLLDSDQGTEDITLQQEVGSAMFDNAVDVKSEKQGHKEKQNIFSSIFNGIKNMNQNKNSITSYSEVSEFDASLANDIEEALNLASILDSQQCDSEGGISTSLGAQEDIILDGERANIDTSQKDVNQQPRVAQEQAQPFYSSTTTSQEQIRHVSTVGINSDPAVIEESYIDPTGSKQTGINAAGKQDLYGEGDEKVISIIDTKREQQKQDRHTLNEHRSTVTKTARNFGYNETGKGEEEVSFWHARRPSRYSIKNIKSVPDNTNRWRDVAVAAGGRRRGMASRNRCNNQRSDYNAGEGRVWMGREGDDDDNDVDDESEAAYAALMESIETEPSSQFNEADKQDFDRVWGLTE